MDTRLCLQDAIADGTRLMITRRNANERYEGFSEWKARRISDGSISVIADFEDGTTVTWPIPTVHVQVFIELVAIDHARGHVIAEGHARRANARHR